MINHNVFFKLANGLVRFGVYNRIIKAATEVARCLKFDFDEVRKLCSQLYKYKENKEPFNIPFSYEDDSPITWWESIELESNQLQKVAIYIMSICPNSASCERGFSALGWLTGKKRLRLGVERLETMMKLITYYRSNAQKELLTYGDKMTESQIMEIVQLSLATPIEEEEDDDDSESEERTITGENIPEDNVRVVIEPLWLDKTLYLDHKIIVEDLGEIPIDDDSDVDEVNDTRVEDLNIRERRFDFSVKDLITEYGEN